MRRDRSSSPSERPVNAAVEADDPPLAGIGDKPHLAGLTRLEPGRGARGNVEPETPRLIAVEGKRRVGLVEMIMRADLDRPVTGIGHAESHGHPPRVQLDIASGDEDFT